MPPEIHSPARDPATASATRTRRRAARDTTQAARQDSSVRVAATCHPLAVDRKMGPCRVSSGRALVSVSATVTSTGSAFIHHGPGELRACRARGFWKPVSSSATPAAAPTRPAPAAGSESSDCSRGRMEVAQVHRATATVAASPRPDRDTVPLPAYRPARQVLRSRQPPHAFMHGRRRNTGPSSYRPRGFRVADPAPSANCYRSPAGCGISSSERSRSSME